MIPVKIHIVSKFVDLSAASHFTGEDIERSFKKAMECKGAKLANGKTAVELSEIVSGIIENASERAVDNVELSTEGSLGFDKEGNMCLSYPENDVNGMSGSETALVFNPDDRGTVSMIRTGTVKSAMIFSLHQRRQICVYDFGFADPMEMCLHTHVIDNRLNEEGGTLAIDYTIEMQGNMTEYNSLRLEVRKTEDPFSGMLEWKQ